MAAAVNKVYRLDKQRANSGGGGAAAAALINMIMPSYPAPPYNLYRVYVLLPIVAGICGEGPGARICPPPLITSLSASGYRPLHVLSTIYFT